MRINDGVALIVFDLPSTTKEERSEYNKFRRNIKKLGYVMYQESIYYKYLRSIRSFKSEILNINCIKVEGDIKLLKMTVNEFNEIKNISGNKIQILEIKEVLHF